MSADFGRVPLRTARIFSYDVANLATGCSL
jgi:hypothetical protein